MKKTLIYILSVFTLVSCEDVISVEIDEGERILVVDAFLTLEAGTQTVKLTSSADYFDNNGSLPATGANVELVSGSGPIYTLTEVGSTGEYVWTGSGTDTLLELGETYDLNITYLGENYSGTSKVNPVPAIDSIRTEFFDDESGLGTPGYFAEFFATDLVGSQDFYWIRHHVNGTRVIDPAAINVAVDGSFNEGPTDGYVFIFPLRTAINNFSDPYELGDSLTVEVLSIDEATFLFFQEARTQMNNGGLFATPPSNVRTNVFNTDNSSNSKALGWFSTSSISRLSKIVD